MFICIFCQWQCCDALEVFIRNDRQFLNEILIKLNRFSRGLWDYLQMNTSTLE